MALPTGSYRAVLLWAKRHGIKKFYTLEFALESGQRDRATVMFKDMAKVFTPAGFIMRENFTWSARDPSEPQPLLNLELSYSPKFQSTRAVSASKTGEFVACDIRPTKETGYEDY